MSEGDFWGRSNSISNNCVPDSTGNIVSSSGSEIVGVSDLRSSSSDSLGDSVRGIVGSWSSNCVVGVSGGGLLISCDILGLKRLVSCDKGGIGDGVSLSE